MGIQAGQVALLIIDMQKGFIEPESALCIAGAKATVDTCAKVVERARNLGVLVCFIRREYAADGSNVESVRYEAWAQGGKPLSAASILPGTLEFPEELSPEPSDCIITKPRFSAFFQTALDEELRSRAIDTVLLIGTTTPNCIRATCFDAISLDYNVAIIEDCTSSRSLEAQKANIADFEALNVQVLNSEEFCRSGLQGIQDIQAQCREARNSSNL